MGRKLLSAISKLPLSGQQPMLRFLSLSPAFIFTTPTQEKYQNSPPHTQTESKSRCIQEMRHCDVGCLDATVCPLRLSAADCPSGRERTRCSSPRRFRANKGCEN